MSKVLYIISEFFAPCQDIASIKFTKIVKFLSRNSNFKIIIFTRKNFEDIDILLKRDLDEMKKNGVEVYYIDAGKR